MYLMMVREKFKRNTKGMLPLNQDGTFLIGGSEENNDGSNK
jgi:hypothetical protein